MRVLIVTPRQDRATGNHVTAERHRRGLESAGWTVQVADAPEDPLFLEEFADLFRPDVLLLLHAYRTGKLWLKAPRAYDCPAVVLLTGTDIHGGIDSPGEREVIREVLSRAAAIVTQNPLTFEALRAANPEMRPRLHYLPPGVVLGSVPLPLRALSGIRPGDVLFLHPAGIRPVKGNLELLRLFAPLGRSRLGFRVAFCGPVLDEAYSHLFHEELRKCPWAFYAGIIPPPAMAAALTEADVVLNNSEKEGMPNTLIEASVLGRPILARDNPGNRAAVQEGVNGLLYRNSEEFAETAGRLVDDPQMRKNLSVPSPDRYRPEEEARVLNLLLRSILALPLE